MYNRKGYDDMCLPRKTDCSRRYDETLRSSSTVVERRYFQYLVHVLLNFLSQPLQPSYYFYGIQNGTGERKAVADPMPKKENGGGSGGGGNKKTTEKEKKEAKKLRQAAKQDKAAAKRNKKEIKESGENDIEAIISGFSQRDGERSG